VEKSGAKLLTRLALAVTQLGVCASSIAAAPDERFRPITGTRVAASTAPMSSEPEASTASDASRVQAQPRSQFRVADGKILSPDGAPFIAKGINLYDSQLSCCTTNAMNLFKGMNFVRVAVEHYASAAALRPYVAQLTSAGIVVEIEDHSAPCCKRNVLSGKALAKELDWYSSLAKAFKDNPHVWFGTMNEPDDRWNIASVAQQERSIYDAIRATGNTNPILLQCRGGWVADFAIQNPAYFASMTNVIWEPHFYGGTVDSSTDQAAVKAGVLRAAASWGDGGVELIQTVRGADGVLPVIIGEYGVSTSGSGPCDPNYMQVLHAVQQSGYGSAAWAYSAGTDTMVSGNNRNNYGQEVAEWIRSGVTAPFSVCP
jgi:hypothetical protein